MTDAIGRDTAAAALHGSWCPKMCSFACPVTAATGREDAVPWSFHRTVVELDGGRLPLTEASHARLEACTGCLSCREPCLWDQDVPSQVRAGRRALVSAGAAPAATREAIAAVAAGRSPYGHDLPVPRDGGAGVTAYLGCRDGSAELVDAVARLLTGPDGPPRVVVPPGCCGGVLRDLGADDAADARAAAVRDALEGAERVVATDPHCLEELRRTVPDATVVDLVTELDQRLEDGRLRPRKDAGAREVTYHDPCILARGEEVVDAPRRLLAAAGTRVTEPEGRGAGTVCSGAGLGMDLLAPADADATAERRRASLPPGLPVVTACAGARARLAAAGADAVHLAVLLVDHLEARP